MSLLIWLAWEPPLKLSGSRRKSHSGWRRRYHSLFLRIYDDNFDVVAFKLSPGSDYT